MDDIKITTNLLRSAKLTWLIGFGMAVISSILFSLLYWKLKLAPDKFGFLVLWSIVGIGAPILVLLLGAFAFETFSLLFLLCSTIMFRAVNQRIGLIRSGVVLIILLPSLYYTALFYPIRSIKRDEPAIQMQQDSLKYLQGWKWKAPPDSIRSMVLLTENSTLDNCFPLTDELFRHAITAAGKIKGFKLLSPTAPDSLLALANKVVVVRAAPSDTGYVLKVNIVAWKVAPVQRTANRLPTFVSDGEVIDSAPCGMDSNAIHGRVGYSMLDYLQTIWNNVGKI